MHANGRTLQKMGVRMADHGAPQGQLGEHEGTYTGFAALMKWGTIASFLVAALVVWLIA